VVKTKNTLTIDYRGTPVALADYPDLLRGQFEVKHADSRNEPLISRKFAVAAIYQMMPCFTAYTPSSQHVPAPQIQIIRRTYQSKEEILSGFDIAACRFAFDGKVLWAHESARSAVVNGVITCSSLHRSFAYESRLLKYAGRGFALSIPELEWDRVPTTILSDGTSTLISFCLHVFNLAIEQDSLTNQGNSFKNSRGLRRLVLFSEATRLRSKAILQDDHDKVFGQELTLSCLMGAALVCRSRTLLNCVLIATV